MKIIKFKLVLTILVLLTFHQLPARAAVTGVCANCHTMHNSQNGEAMTALGADGQPWKGEGPFPSLLRGTCLGCHGQGTSDNIISIGGSDIPQVLHTAEDDLAGGNFAYVLGIKGSGASASKGHNVVELGSNDPNLTIPPGQPHDIQITNTDFHCSGNNGCHGRRLNSAGQGISGEHHRNVNGLCDTATTPANSYRFLKGVKGFENMGPYKYQNYDATNHNEYYGSTSPGETGCPDCHSLHDTAVTVPNNSISGFCSTCHQDYHKLSEIGGNIAGPFTRHPTDIVIKDEGEYAAQSIYNVNVPVGRSSVVSSMSGAVTPGSDVVTCLSCHVAHGSDYPDLLRWDYDQMVAGGGGTGGCFQCHTEKSE